MIPVLRCLLVAAGYAAAGELAGRRHSRSLVAWNESFWMGAGLFAAALVVGSAVGLRVAGGLFFALPVAVVAALVRRGRVPSRPGDRARPFASAAGGARLAWTFVLLGAGVFVVLDARTGYVTDGFGIWASKARVLSIEGRLSRDDAQVDRLGRVANYPPLLPLTEALVGRSAGEFDFRGAKLAFPVFFVSLLVGTWGLARSVLGSNRAAAWTVAIVALLPSVSTDWNAGGFADMPMAAAVAAMSGAWVRGWKRPSKGHAGSGIAGAAMLVKPEGMLLAAVGVVVASLARREGRFRFPVTGAAVLAGFAAAAVIARTRFGVAEGQYGPLDAAHWSMAGRRFFSVSGLAARELASPRNWGIFWVAAVPIALLASVRASEPARSLSRFVVLSVAAATGIFLFSNWGFPGSPAYGSRSLAFHVGVAFPRLLEHLAAPAAVTLVWGYLAVRARRIQSRAGALEAAE